MADDDDQTPVAWGQCPQCGRQLQLIYLASVQGFTWPIHTVIEPQYWAHLTLICPNGADAIAVATAASKARPQEDT